MSLNVTFWSRMKRSGAAEHIRDMRLLHRTRELRLVYNTRCGCSLTEHAIHNLNGEIGRKNSYGNDPPRLTHRRKQIGDVVADRKTPDWKFQPGVFSEMAE